eukprot:TRINITY_DN43833_c0_g1_i1.p1 TRINITY_DN43833_c0_g1~~TRINITY_DN43833_c0_g1_i1.p1  ORF type:complete len:770 (+),score=141.12 TRINITY_DN43833_c0_g1_i1:95-2404(+)
MGCESCKLLQQEIEVHDLGKPAPLGSSEEADVLAFLTKVQLFKRLPKSEHPILARACQTIKYEKNEVVIRQGDPGHQFFVIKRGGASVFVSDGQAEPAMVAHLKPGDHFGETALLRDEPRTATIVADAPLIALTITRTNFETLGLKEKLEFDKRNAVGGGNLKALKTKPPSPKSPAERKLMLDALKKNQNMPSVLVLSDGSLDVLIEGAWKETVNAGTRVIVEGDLNADYFYIVQEGNFEVFTSGITGDSKSAEQAAAATEVERLGTVGSGGSFGELALLYLCPRAATVQATVNSVVWVIDRGNFKRVAAMAAEGDVKQYIKYLDRVDMLASMAPTLKEDVAKALKEMTFKEDERILEQGEEGDTFYILYDGEVAVIKDGVEQVKLTATKAKAQTFGERALINNETRSATVVVTSKVAKALVLDKVSFDMIRTPLTSQDAFSNANRTKIYRRDLKPIGLLGCGAFGAVELVEHKTTGSTYALKGLSKGYVVKCGMQTGIMQEKLIQAMCDSEFIVRLHETFNGNQSIYFLLELALGGELYAVYNKKRFHGSEKHARFYVAGVVFAFEHLHSKKIIFRDLKPENLLLTSTGHIKLTDMGLAKVSIGKTYTTCGTPDYFAPEMISSQGHTEAVDWWTLGILLYELMVGHPPFESPTPMQIYCKVNKGIRRVNFPPKTKGATEELVKSLCLKDPSDRLPMQRGGTKKLKSHAWFFEFDWVRMGNLTLDPPFKPVVKGKKDLANFSARKEDAPPMIHYIDDGTGWDKEFATST